MKVCEAYQKYFGMPVRGQDKHCKKAMEGWLRGEKWSLKFSNPRVWLEPTDHSTIGFFCMVDVSKRRKEKNAAVVDYPHLPSSIAPIPHCSKYPVPVPPALGEVQDKYFDEEEDMDAEELDYLPEVPEKVPHFANQKEVNGLVRAMGSDQVQCRAIHLQDEAVELDQGGNAGDMSAKSSRTSSLSQAFTLLGMASASAMMYLDCLTLLGCRLCPRRGGSS